MELDSDRKSHLWLMAPNALQCMPRIRYVGLDVVRPGMKYRWDATRHSRFNRNIIFQYTLSGQGRLTYRSPTEQINRVKMRRACLLLEDDTLPVSEVARRVGFGNPGQFARVFRRLVGVSPRAFRTHGRMPLP